MRTRVRCRLGTIGLGVFADSVCFHATFDNLHLRVRWGWKACFCSSFCNDLGFTFTVGIFCLFEDGEELLAGADNLARLINDRNGLAKTCSRHDCGCVVCGINVVVVIDVSSRFRDIDPFRGYWAAVLI